MSDSVKLYWNPEYYWNRKNWIVWSDLYEGDHDKLVSTEYLWPHAIELKANDNDSRQLRRSREIRTRYLNLIEILISIWTSYFFRKSPDFGAVKDLLGNRIDNIDGQNTRFASLMKDQSLRDYLLYGKTVLLVTKSPSQAPNLEAERVNGYKPLLKALSPLDVTDWAIEIDRPERAGRFNLLRHEFNLVEPRKNSTEKPEINRYCHVYKYLDPGVEVEIYKIKLDLDGSMPKDSEVDIKHLSQNWQAVQSATLDLEEIPAVQLIGESWMRDAAQEVLRCHNLRSNRDNVQYMQGYASDYVTGVDPGNSELRAAVGEYAKMLYPEGAIPGRLQPVTMADYDKAVQDSIDLTFKVGLNLFRSIPSDSREGQSADSMSEEKDNPLALVESTIADLENLFNGGLEHFAAFMGEEPPSGRIELFKEVSAQSFNRFVQVVNGFRDYLKRSDTAQKEISKKAVNYLDLDDKVLKMIDKEIDQSSNPDEGQQTNPREFLTKAINGETRSGEAKRSDSSERGTGQGVSSEAQ